MRAFCLIATIVALVAVLWSAAPVVVNRLIKRASDQGDAAPMGLKRLLVGHAMAGGGDDPEKADSALADVLKSVAVTKVLGAKADAAVRGVPSTARDSWRMFTAALGEAESEYISPGKGFGLGPADVAAHEVSEGLRYIGHISRLALELYMETMPRFVKMVSPTLKLIGDNPDAIYYISRIDAAKRYEVSGCRTGEKYFSISVHAAAREGEAFQRVVADVNDDGLKFDDKGCYTLRLEPEGGSAAAAGTALRVPVSAVTVITRHYFEEDPPAQLSGAADGVLLRIREAGSAGPPPLVTDAETAARIDEATLFVRSHTVLMPLPDPTSAPPFFSLMPNVIGPPMKWSREHEGMGAVDIAYGAGRFLLSADAAQREALVIRGKMPQCRFANVVLWNRYLQSFDYEHRTSSLNRKQLKLNERGAPLARRTSPHRLEQYPDRGVLVRQVSSRSSSRRRTRCSARPRSSAPTGSTRRGGRRAPSSSASSCRRRRSPSRARTSCAAPTRCAPSTRLRRLEAVE